MRLARYLGKPVYDLIDSTPFNSWPVKRGLSYDDPPDVFYVFKEHGLEVHCDAISENVQSIFIKNDGTSTEKLTEISFTTSRKQLISRFGEPNFSRGQMTHSILGYWGPADRFHVDSYQIFFEYFQGYYGIKTINFMRNDVVPK